MERAVRIVKDVLVIALLAMVLYVGWRVSLIAGRVDALLAEHKELATDAREALSGAMHELDATLQRVSVTADTMAGAAKEQRRQALVTTLEVTALVKDARETLYRVNNETIPALNSAIADSSKNLGRVTEEAAALIHDTNERLEPLLANTTQVAANSAKATEQLTAAMVDVQSGMKHLDGTLANVEKTSASVEKALRPGKLAWRGVNWVWDKIVSLLTAAK